MQTGEALGRGHKLTWKEKGCSSDKARAALSDGRTREMIPKHRFKSCLTSYERERKIGSK